MIDSAKTLEKAIEKANKHGYILPSGLEGIQNTCHIANIYETVIFSHDFAKAFWGEEIVCEMCGVLGVAHKRHEILGTIPCSYWIPQWQEHLKKMVIQEDPLKYISKYL